MEGHFPNIQPFLDNQTYCWNQAQKYYGCRNLVVVLHDIYNKIPEDLPELRKKYCKTIDRWLRETVYYIAPELHAQRVWGPAGHIIAELFSAYKDSDWEKECIKKFTGK